MTTYSEKTSVGLLTGAVDADGDLMTVSRINDITISTWPHLLAMPVGTASVTQSGVVSYDDGGSTAGHPSAGATQSNGSFTFRLTDGQDESPEYTATLQLAGLTQSGGTTPTNPVTQISDNGVIWNFGATVEAGQFWNGDWFIVVPSGAVNITSISPASSGGENGAMKNFTMATTAAADTTHGFSSSTGSMPYSSGANDDPGNSGALSVTAGDAVIKCISGGGAISKYRILTVLDTAPPVNAFRPSPYGPGGRTATLSEADVNRSQLQSLVAPAGQLTPSQYRTNYKTSEVALTWLNANHVTRQYSPTGGMLNYGSSMGAQLSQAMLSLHANHSQAEKDPLMVDIIQIGIDILGTVEHITTSAYDRNWIVSTMGFPGSTPGRGFFSAGGNHAWADQAAFAAAVLINDTGLRSLVGSSEPVPNQTWNANDAFFTVGAGDVNRTLNKNGGVGSYSRVWTFESGHVGLPAYGISHGAGAGIGWWGADNDSANIGGSYLDINTQAFFGMGLFLMLCPDGDTVIDVDPIFDMMDRVRAYIEPFNYFYGTDGTNPHLNDANAVTPAEINAWATWRSLAFRPAYSKQPEVMMPPSLSGGGNTITVNQPPVSPNGAAVTRWDIRYRSTGTTSFGQGSGIFSEAEDQEGAGGWSVLNDITWSNGQRAITGLGSGSYRVQVRAHNANGVGPWTSNNPVRTSDTAARGVISI